jgi:uncharacterized protein YbjT (DUF2867 family)
MTYLIHGASGAQGAPVAAALSEAGHSVRAAVRDTSSYDGDAVAVDYADQASLVRAYAGVDGVFVHLPLGPPDQQLSYAKAIAAAIGTAQPARVVISTSGYQPADVDQNDGSAMGTLISGVRDSGVSFAVIAPRLYLENLLLPPVTGPAREEGVLRYPIREDYRVSWASHLDIADVAVRLFEDTTVAGTVSVGALPGLVGDDLAAGFAAHFGREARFETQTPEDMGRALAPLFGEAGIAPVVESYHWRLTQADELISEDDSAQRRLGIEPRSVAQWLNDVGF